MSSLQSILPPASVRGGTVECSPGPAGATPVTPRNGASDLVYFPLAVAVPAGPSISHSSHARSAPTSPSRRSTAESGTDGDDVQPHSSGVSDTIRTASMSPGTTPRTAIGRFRQCPTNCPGNIFGCPASPGNSCRFRYPAASSERTSTVSPGSMVSAGRCPAEKTLTVLSGVGSRRWKVIKPIIPNGRGVPASRLLPACAAGRHQLRIESLKMASRSSAVTSRGAIVSRRCCLTAPAIRSGMSART